MATINIIEAMNRLRSDIQTGTANNLRTKVNADDFSTSVTTGTITAENILLGTEASSSNIKDLIDSVTNTANANSTAIGTLQTNSATKTELAAKLDSATAATTYVPVTRKINNKALNADITLTAGDVGAATVDSVTALDNSLATVAKSGSYNDLTNKPTIPAAVTDSTVSGGGYIKKTAADEAYAAKSIEDTVSSLQEQFDDLTATGGEPNVKSDGNETDTNSDAFIINKPDLSVYETKTNAASTYAPKSLSDTVSQLSTTVSGKQDKISDLSSIRSGATAGATALQPSALDGYLTESAADGKYATITTAQDLQDNIDAVEAKIPTVNNATLTIQKNGTSIGTFTANQSSAKNINIEVPTKVTDLSDGSSYATQTYVDKAVLEVATGGNVSVPVEDVKVNGASVVTDKIAQITVPNEVTETTVSGGGFTKNTGTYSKPSGGIPKSDLESAVQTSLGKADTALQSYTEQYTGTITGVTVNGTSVATSGVANITIPESLPANGGNADTVGGFTVNSNVPSNAVFTDNSTNELGHYTPAIAAFGNKQSADSGKYISGIELDSNKHVVGIETRILPTFTEQYKGTVTGIALNGTSYVPNNGVVDLGTINTDTYTKTEVNNLIDDVKDQVTGGEIVAGAKEIIVNGTSYYMDSSGVITFPDLNTINNTSIIGGGNISTVYVVDFTIQDLEDRYNSTDGGYTAFRPQGLTSALEKNTPVLIKYNSGVEGYVPVWGYVEDLLYLYFFDGQTSYSIETGIENGCIYKNEITKSNLYSKQDKINDLDTIRSGASLGATALQPGDLDDIDNKATNGSYLVDKSITVSAAGWYKIASYTSTTLQPRGSVKFLIATTGGSYTPDVTEFSGNLSWDLSTNSHFLITGHNPYKSKVRFSKDASNVYIEVYFSQAFTSNMSLKVLRPTYCGATQNSAGTGHSGALTTVTPTEMSSECGGVEGIYYTADITSTGNITATSFFKTSDETLKDFKGDLDVNFDIIKSIPKKYFTGKDNRKPGLQIGTSAQELQKNYPELVSKNSDGKLAVDYSTLSIIALAAIDKLYEENQKLKDRLNKLEYGN